MNFPNRRVFRLLLLLLDICALVAAFHLAVETRLALNSFYGYQMSRGVVDVLTPPLSLILLLWIPMSWWVSLYRPRRGGIVAGSISQILESVAAVAILTIVITFFIRNFGGSFSRSFVLFFAAYSTATLMAARMLLWIALSHSQKRGYAMERVAIVGAGADTKALAEHLESGGRLGLTLCGVITSSEPAAGGVLGNPVPVLGTVREIGALINTHRLDRVIAVVSEIDRMTLQRLAATCTRMGVTLNRLPIHSELQAARVRLYEIGDLSLLEVRGIQLTPAQEFVKRVFDITVGTVLLTAAGPLMAVLCLIIKTTSRGPVLYVAPRTGKGGRHFPFYKFRSMVADAEHLREGLLSGNEKDGHLFKIRNDPRLTRVGRFMRRYSLDELPQLLNVLKGEMSLVGPRPLPATDLESDGLSRDHTFWAAERTRVLPGITGLWQVRGRSDLGFDDMIRLDVVYVRDWSLLSDLSILMQTLPAVLKGGRVLNAGGMKAGAWGIADQALLSVTNLAVGLLLARELAPGDFGLYVIAFAMILAGSSIQVSLITDPLLVLGAAKHGADQSRYLASLLWLQVIVSISVAGCMVAISESTRLMAWPAPGLPAALTAAAAVIVPVQLQGFFRAVLFCRLRAEAVFANDLICCLVRLITVLILLRMERLTVSTAVLAGGAAASIAAIAAAPVCRDLLLSTAQRLRSTWKAHWNYGRWLLATSAAFWLSGQAPALVASAFLTPVAAAVLKACQYFIAPLNVAFTGLDGVLAPRVTLRRALGGDDAVSGFLRRFTLAAAAVVAVYGLVLLPFTPALLAFLYKGQYRGYTPVVVILLVDALLSALARGPILKLKVMGDTRRIFMAYLCAAVAGLFTMAVLAPIYGIVGAAYSAPAASAALLGFLLIPRTAARGGIVVEHAR